jgi:stress response protein YsnF
MAKSGQYVGRAVADRDGQVLGKVQRVFTDDTTGMPTWVSVLVGRREYLVPLAGARQEGDGVRIQYSAEMVERSPQFAFDNHVDAGNVATLQRYYDDTMTASTRTESDTRAQTTAPADAGARTAGSDAAGGGANAQAGGANAQAGGEAAAQGDMQHAIPSEMHRDATMEMVRHEERVHVAKESREAGRVRLRRYVERVPFEQKVQLGHETFEVQHMPITDTAELAATQPDWREQVQELVLFGEQAHTAKDVVAVERVVVSKKMITEEQTIRDTIMREQFEVIEAAKDGDNRATAGAGAGADARSGGGRMDPPSSH